MSVNREEMKLSNWPIEFGGQLDIGNFDSEVGIITLWTKKEIVEQKVSSDNYCIIGQLYSREEGINSLLRNSLANKNLRYLILTGVDLSGSGKVIVDFFSNGINEDNRVIGSEDIIVDKEIPILEVNNFKENVKLINMIGEKDFAKISDVISGLDKKGSYGKNEVYPKKQIKPPQIYDSEKAGFVIRDTYIKDAWVRILNLVMNFGNVKETQYSEEQKELISLVSVIDGEDPRNPKMGHVFDFLKSDLDLYYPQILSGDAILGVEYTYGQRLRNNDGIDQIDAMISRLKKVSHTRRAVAFTWNVKKDYNSKNAPCLNVIHAQVQDGKLFLTAYFRSNDMYNAWPKNAFGLRMLQYEMTEKLGLEVGPLIIVSDSAHIYKSSWKKASAILKHFPVSVKNLNDPRGNYVIRVDNESDIQSRRIIVVRQGQNGTRVKEYDGKTAVEIFDKLAVDDGILEVRHALYLGSELQKAEIALNKDGVKYVQDKELKF